MISKIRIRKNVFISAKYVYYSSISLLVSQLQVDRKEISVGRQQLTVHGAIPGSVKSFVAINKYPLFIVHTDDRVIHFFQSTTRAIYHPCIVRLITVRSKSGRYLEFNKRVLKHDDFVI